MGIDRGDAALFPQADPRNPRLRAASAGCIDRATDERRKGEPMNTRLRGGLGIAVAALAVLATSAGGGSANPGAVPSTAQPLGYAPATVQVEADARKPEQGAPVPSCAAVAGVQWY